MATKKHATLSEAMDQLDCSPSEVRRLIEEEVLVARRDDPTGPLRISQASIDEYLDAEDDDEEAGDFDSGVLLDISLSTL